MNTAPPLPSPPLEPHFHSPSSAMAAGHNLLRSGQREAAAKIFAKILQEEPANTTALHMLGVTLAEGGKPEDGRKLIETALALNPREPDAHLNLATLHAAAGDFARAIEVSRTAQPLFPQHAALRNFLGRCLLREQQPEAALAVFQEGIRIAPHNRDLWINAGVAHHRLGNIVHAVAHARQAIEIDETSADAQNNLGNALKDGGRPDLAVSAYAYALRLNPALANAAVHLGMAYLLMGDFARGLEWYEKRAIVQEIAPARAEQRVDPARRWQGQPRPEARILLYAEQGFGDAIQFLRYVTEVAARIGHVTLEVPRPLWALARTLPVPVTLRAPDDPPLRAGAEYDLQAPLMSLPAIFGTRLDTIPAATPYLHAAPEKAQAWALHLPPGARTCVGLVWAGNPGHANDHNRSITLATLAPLLQLAGVQFFSLQKIAGAAPPPLPFTDFAPHLHDFSDTAAALANLDLLITVDTSVAHLAGAMGRPVWLLLPYMPDWRWLLGREDSPWYPSMRIFRQTKPGDWKPVIEQVCRQLAMLASGNASVLRAPPFRSANGRPLQAHPDPIIAA